MGEVAQLSKALSMRVQDIAQRGEEISPAYHCRDDKGMEIVPPSHCPVPIININLLSPSLIHTQEGENELQKLKSALSTWGCFLAIEHGISLDFQAKVIKTAREFFDLPFEEKNKYAKTLEGVQGYGGDPLPTEEGMKIDWFDRLYIDTFPEEARDYKFWPTKPTSFREVMIDYCLKMKVITTQLNKAIARSLGLEEDCFVKQFGGSDKEFMQVSWNYYPPCPKPDLILGLRPHSDGSGYTMLLNDDVGLQVENNNKWYMIPQIPNAITFLLGDQMEIMTNGIFKSVEHRVSVGSEKDRISVGVFYSPNAEKEIGPVEGLTKEEGAKYKKVKNYIGLYFDYSITSIKPIDHARISYEGLSF